MLLKLTLTTLDIPEASPLGFSRKPSTYKLLPVGALSPQAVEEEHLPADFRKRLTEWEIAKALAGKSQQNVEQLQKHLPSEFNKKYEEWRLKMKMAEVKAGHGAPAQGQVRRRDWKGGAITV